MIKLAIASISEEELSNVEGENAKVYCVLKDDIQKEVVFVCYQISICVRVELHTAKRL